MTVIDYICGGCWSKFKCVKESEGKHIFCPKCLGITVHPVEATVEYNDLLSQNHHINRVTTRQHGA